MTPTIPGVGVSPIANALYLCSYLGSDYFDLIFIEGMNLFLGVLEHLIVNEKKKSRI